MDWVFVWTIQDVVGTAILAVIILFFAFLFVWDWVETLKTKFKRRKGKTNGKE